MATIYTIKELETPDTPLLLFECRFADGTVERWSTHEVQVEGNNYAARVLTHNVFELRGGSEDGVDGVSRVSLTLANADSHCSQIEGSIGFKGSKLIVRFAFYDLKINAATTPTTVLFRGTANAPEDSTEAHLRVSFTSRLNLSRVLLPNSRIQRRCPWVFPRTAEQRAEAPSGLDNGKYSPYFRCGYAADQPEPDRVGNLDAGGQPFTDCNFSRANCEQRGMFSKDSQNKDTRRFGGIEFVPASILVRGSGENGRHASNPAENTARYNDFVPMIYGTAWYEPPIVFARNDGNLTHLEVLLGLGEIEGVLKVVVNGIEIPLAQDGSDMTATGWYAVVSHGNRTGNFNNSFTTTSGAALGDPYGSMAYLSVIVPNRISDGRSLPKVEAMVQGLKVSLFDSETNYVGEAFSNNPAWVLLDVIRRCGWTHEELDITSFYSAAVYCDELIAAKDLNGNNIQIPRYQTNLVLRRRQSAAEIVRGIRNACALYLTYADGGKLQLRTEGQIAIQQPAKPPGSNSLIPLDGGWPAYEFGDGSNGFSSILRQDSGAPTIHVFSRSTADTPNRVSLEFQDAFNEYQQDSVSLVDPDDVVLVGQEVSASVNAAGIPNIDQALRIARLQLNKSIYGNTYVEFETSMRGLGIRPGDLITLTYLKEGFNRQLFRVTRIAPKTNFRTASITAQIHDEGWYDPNAEFGGSQRRRRSAETGIPQPITGKILDSEGVPQFEITEEASPEGDGGSQIQVTVGFTAPAQLGQSRSSIPLLSFGPSIFPTGGTLKGAQNLYYAVSGVDADGFEGEQSFSVRASIQAGPNTNSVRLNELSFNAATTAFHVYRGTNPQQMQRIATNVPVANQFIDSGLPPQLALPPDPSYDHTNFYWRIELLPETGATIFTPTTVGNSSLSLQLNEFRGAVVRITSGKGTGQDRTIIANDSNAVAIDVPWTIVPDSTSEFVIAEAGWKFGALSRSDRAVFSIPNRPGAIVQIIGRAANVRDEECAAEISPLTRWTIDGAGAEGGDADVPGEPIFSMTTTGEGTLELLSVSFLDFDNTTSVTAGTLVVYYWNELESPSSFTLAVAIDEDDDIVELNNPGTAAVGKLIQIESEVMEVLEVLDGGLRYRVARGAYESTAAIHDVITPKKVFHLSERVVVVPFVKNFFGSQASGSFGYPISFPHGRVAAASLFMTNSRGESPIARRSFTANTDQGLRCLSGGQMTLQRNGYLSIQSNVAPPLIVNNYVAIRDVFATVREAPVDGDIQLRVLVNGATYCDLTILAGDFTSDSFNAFDIPPLLEKAVLTLDVLSVPPSEPGSPGSPGADLTVTLRH